MELKNIDIVKNISKKDFAEYYDKPQKPVIIKGIAYGTKAGHTWSLEYFKQRLGDIIVGVYDNNRKSAKASAYTRPDLKMRFGDYLDILSCGNQPNLRIFLFNIFKYDPQLRSEFPCPELCSGLLDQMGYMFFGARNTTVRIHYDIDMSSVLHTHFGGRKRVVLMAPEYSDLLYKLPLNTYSLIDFDHPDYDKYPGLRYIKYYDFILEPGDSVFMPSAYWHYMTYLDNSFSVSYRKLAPGLQGKIKGLTNMGLYVPIDKLLNMVAGTKWLEEKQIIAEKRADKRILSFYGKYVEQVLKTSGIEIPDEEKNIFHI